MQLMEPSSAGFMYSDAGGRGPPVVFFHGVLMNGALWDDIVDQLSDRYRCIVPELPFGAHRTPMPDDADLMLEPLVKMVADFLAELDLRDVTLVCNDWGGAQLVVSPGGSDRVANLVLISCEAFDNYPPGFPGRLLCLNASLPGGTYLTAQLLRPRFVRHLPISLADYRRSGFPTISSSAGSSRCVATARSAAISTSISAASRREHSCLIGPSSNAPLRARFWSCGLARTS